jgi:hypothetical protein
MLGRCPGRMRPRPQLSPSHRLAPAWQPGLLWTESVFTGGRRGTGRDERIGIRDGRRPVRYDSRHIHNGSQLLTGAGMVTPAWPSQCLCTGGTAAHCPGSRPGGLWIRSPHRYLRIPGRQWCRCPTPHSPAPHRRRTFPLWPMGVPFAPPRNHYTSGKVYELEYPRPSTSPILMQVFC